MELTHLPRALAAGLVLVLPATAQDAPIVAAPPAIEGTAPPVVVEAAAPLAIAPARPGLFGWRRRHAERKQHLREHKRHLQDKFLGYPEEFNEWPLGKALYAHGRTEVANGVAARTIFNHYDFVGDTTELNVRGRDKLAAISARLATSFDPVLVERTPATPGVDQARRLAILSKLAEGPFPVPAERVIVAAPVSTGLRGPEAVIVNGTRLNQVANSGIFSNGGGAAGGGGAGPGGFDGSGLSGSATSGGGSGGIAR